MTEQDNRFDLEVRSIFEDAQEEVPESVWENLTPRLDIMAEERRRKVFLRWTRRVTVATSIAAAAAIAILFPWGTEISVPAPDNYAIAVAEPVPETKAEEKYIALAATPAEKPVHKTVPAAIPQDIPSSSDITENTAVAQTEPENKQVQEKPASVEEYIPEYDAASDILYNDIEDEDGKNKPSVSIVMSGNASSNSISKNGRGTPMRVPEKLQPGSRYEKESAYGIPLTFGIGARIEFTPRWAMSVGVNYTMLSRSFKGFYTDDNGLPLPETSFVNTQSYIGIPVNVYFNILSGDFADFYAYAGGTFEKCVYNKFAAKGTASGITTEKTGGVQCSANIGLGVEFILADWLGLYIDPSLRYYFKGNLPKSIRTQQPLQLGFELGLRVRL